MSKEIPWHVAERAWALAVLLLTERGDLSVKRLDHPGDGLDLLVEIPQAGQATRALLGIQLHGTSSPASEKEAARALAAGAASVSGLPFPVCGFFFDVRQNEGCYAWLNEPVLSKDGGPRLVPAKPAEAARLDTAAVDEIIGCVNRWYDARLVFSKRGAAAG
jgi:hypothetical protein